MQKVLGFCALQHLLIVHIGIIRRTLRHAAKDVLGGIDIKGIHFLGDLRELAPIGFLGIIEGDNLIHTHVF